MVTGSLLLALSISAGMQPLPDDPSGYGYGVGDE
jgi:hypothetical protein